MIEAIKNWKEVYTKVLLSKEEKPYNLEVAISYAVQDMINSVKSQTEENAAAIINDDAEWMLEKMAA